MALWSDTTTHNIRVVVRPEYLPESSKPEYGHYLFAYHIVIQNLGADTVKLVSRHWLITNGEGRVEEVRGSGVVGEQPVLKPGMQFEYSSGCPLDTPHGEMRGSYQMVNSRGERFDAVVGAFRLETPNAAPPPVELWPTNARP